MLPGSSPQAMATGLRPEIVSEAILAALGGHIKFSRRIIVSAFWWTLTTHLEMQPGEIELDRLEFILNGVWICSASHVYWLYCSLS